jgi:hypothetical protein
MPGFDNAAKAQLGRSYKAPAWFMFADVLGDPLRATTYGKAITFSGTGDADLDGQTYSVPTDKRVLSVGNVGFGEGGSDTLSVFLSGIVTIDTTLLNAIGDRSKWLGRAFRLWALIFDETGTQQGAICEFYTGVMAGVDIHPSAKRQTIELKIENYLALALSQGSNRGYLCQSEFDAADTSAAATLAAANNARGPGGATIAAGGGGGGGGGGVSDFASLLHLY